MKRVEDILRCGEMGPFSVAYCGREVRVKEGQIAFAKYFRSSVFLQVYDKVPEKVEKPDCSNENCQAGVMPIDFQNDSGICPCCGYPQINSLPVCNKLDCKYFKKGKGTQVCSCCYFHDSRLVISSGTLSDQYEKGGDA